ncbi:MAG: tol-pal system protein YbgF [Sandaracinaceae bacterium]|nr:tol-pal system protein YbgF [Sandaracinaceae bacterium]
MRLRLLLPILCSLAGCAAAPPPAPAAPASLAAEAEPELVATLRRQNRELSTQLGLARAEATELRDEVAALREDAARRVVRITQAPACEPTAAAASASAAETEEARDEGPRPVLRLYGSAPVALDAARPAANARGVTALPGPEAPAWVEAPPLAAARLPVFGTAEDPTAGVPAIPRAPVDVLEAAPPAAPTPAADAASRAYRVALAAFTERRIPDAIRGFDDFVREHPSHPYADNAMYWRAEIDYSRGDFGGALARFSALIERYPRGNKVPDALLRIGLCYERMGQRDRARRVFSRLRQQYPDTVAARMASREDA